MGSTGANKSGGGSSSLEDRITQAENEHYTSSSKLSQTWFKEHSNIVDWSQNLLGYELDALKSYTGSGYIAMNQKQYTTPWEDMEESVVKDKIADLHDALSKSELYDGVIVNRGSDFQIFGADYHENMTMKEIRDYLTSTNGVVQNDGFMSFTTASDGHAIAGNGLITHLRVPPSTGAGAFVNHLSSHKGEDEFLVNNNVILRFDTDSMYMDKNGKIHIDAYWLGNSRAQTISPTYTGNLRR